MLHVNYYLFLSIFISLFIYLYFSIEAICKIIAYGFILSPTLTRNHVYKSIIHQFIYFQTPDSPSNQQANKKKPNHKAYMCSFGNFIDIVSIVSYWIDLSLMIEGYPYISLFKSLGAMRPIRLLSLLPGTAVSLTDIKQKRKKEKRRAGNRYILYNILYLGYSTIA